MKERSAAGNGDERPQYLLKKIGNNHPAHAMIGRNFFDRFFAQSSGGLSVIADQSTPALPPMLEAAAKAMHGHIHLRRGGAIP
ncbi:hypothetical protein D3C71_1885120 [compost metagenome]